VSLLVATGIISSFSLIIVDMYISQVSPGIVIVVMFFCTVSVVVL